ncbi:hypothetical protein Tco_1122285 [Tanacetum coccineum]|uniref:Ty3 transposon capsid-like protein domain-containing protein n=1 Tax=Tanacetum coccineum TaxID=301880 RepID=A0ABQ5J1Q8_9ASTR
MEEELYNLTVKGNDLKPYVRRFQELTILCPNMVPNTEKLLEAFIGGLPRSIEENVTASKPQTLEEAINIAQRLMDQEVDINKKTENQAKMTKLSMEWKRLCKIKDKVQKIQRSESQYRRISSKTGAGTEGSIARS